MAIELIAKIAPKNDGFLGMVDANQVIGTSGGVYSSYLPSSAISTNSLSEPYLRVSNSPTDGYYLKWDDSTKLTWSEVVGGTDVAWSGASGYYSYSSNAKKLYVGSSQALAKFAPSRSINNGLQQIYDGSGAISHGLISTPRHWDLKPSGNVNFGINTKVDATYIYVNLTTRNDKYVYWYAST